MTRLQFWIRPALLISLWMVVAALTLSELSTVAPALLSAGQPALSPELVAVQP